MDPIILPLCYFYFYTNDQICHSKTSLPLNIFPPRHQAHQSNVHIYFRLFTNQLLITLPTMLLVNNSLALKFNVHILVLPRFRKKQSISAFQGHYDILLIISIFTKYFLVNTGYTICI